MISHPISPVFNSESEILILGSFPSVKSRESGFFYGHKQNRFWRMLSLVFEDPLPETIDEKKEFLLKHKIALWDVIAQCEITGSSDSSIKNVTVNDFDVILNTADIRRICTNGQKAHSLYKKYAFPKTKTEDICLPSTSPANAAWSLDDLVSEWKKALLNE